MGKEQISIRLEPDTLRQIDRWAVDENRTRNNMIEVLLLESINDRLFEQFKRLKDSEGETLKEEIKRSRFLAGAGRGRRPKPEPDEPDE
jgi:hypothetical protein